MDLPKDYQYMLYRAPSIRYHDTSYIINKKWFKGEDELAFPLLHHYINLNEKVRGTSRYDSNSDRYATDSEANDKVKRKRTHKDKQQRYTRSLERSTKRSNSFEDAITTTDDDFLNEAQELKTINNNERIRSLLIDESEEKSMPSDNSANKHEKQINNNNNKKNVEINIVKFELVSDPNNKKNVLAAEKTDSESNIQLQTDKIKEQLSNDEETIAIIQQLDNNGYNQRKSQEPRNVNFRNEEMVSVDIHTRPTSVSSSSTISNHVLQISEDVTDPRHYYIIKENSTLTQPEKFHNNQTDQTNRNSSASTASNVTYISTGSQKTLTDLTKKNSDSPTVENYNYEENCVQQAFILGNNLKSTSTVNEYEDDSSIDGSEIVVLRGNQDEYGNEHRIDPGYASIKYKSFPAQTKYLPQTPQNSLGAGNVKLHYVTQRILASILPANKDDNEYIYQSLRLRNEEEIQENDEKEIILMLEQKHGKNYKIFDLESCISVITLERICELCKHIDKWLSSSKDKVVVLQDREDCQRLGIAIASYLEYLDICASNFPEMKNSNGRLNAHSEDLRAQNTINRNWLNLDMFSMKKFLEDFVGPLKIPSHRRYLRYFSGLLSGKIRMNSSPVLLNYVSVESPPNLLQYHGSSSDAEWKSFIKIYEGLRCVFTSDIHIIPITTRQFLYQTGNLQLRGDILMRCYQVLSADNEDHQFNESRSSSRLTNDRNSYNNENRELLYSLQFHTCAMTSPEVIFRKNDLDYAWCDSRFPKDCKISLRFQSSDKPKDFFFQSPLIRTEKANSLAKADSIENFDLSSKYEGPVNGNLYAAISKSNKSTNQSQQSPLTTQRSSSLSINFSSPSSQSKHLSEGRTINFDTNKKLVVGNNTVIREPQKHLKTVNYLSDQNTSQSDYYTGERVSEYSQTQTNQLNRNISGRKQTTKNPLTLSLDSGISSTGLINRRQQCTSTSPSSFPSQTSPQDRHKELDDILNDMLMTVQDIPDYQNKSQKQRLIRSSSASATTSSTNHQQPTYFLLPATHRSRSYTATYGNIIQPRDRDYCDTASTATTVTPTPSESGRNTPIAQQHCNYQTQKRQRSNTVSSMASSNITTTATSSSVGHIHNNNNYDQSSLYPQKRRTQKISFSETEDEDNIPYHARESSKPFTYGNVPNGHHLLETGNLVNGEKLIESINLEEDTDDPEKMIKLQPGLSSPSLVRKQLGQRVDGNLRKTQENNEFEEILRERREKIERQNLVNDQHFVNNNQPKKTNGYYYYNEPVKRSYNLEGFHRSNSTDGLSGSTWLQMQQQKLRAKKNQQFLGERKYLETLHTEIRNVPSRSRLRNDGYASDTAAFGDEIDYRTPLVVQTHYTDRSPKEKYNTIQTTRTTSYETKERPFVAVKRAHEHARSKRDGSPSLSPLSILKASPTGHLTHLDQNQNGLLLKANSSTSSGRAQLFREESFSSYRSETEPELSMAGSPRPETPAFPTTPRTPYGFHPDGSVSPALPPKSPTSLRRLNNNSSWSLRSGRSTTPSKLDTRSTTTSEHQEVAAHHVKFVRDSSKYWYKPNISREEAIQILRYAEPGTFLVRDSTTFKNAFGLVLRVAHPPPGVQLKPGGDELVRHFLVEPTSLGVRLKGCANEPVFSSLSALVYQHSITPLALPCRLVIPEQDIQSIEVHTPAQKQLLTQGAACNVLYLYACDTESLTGIEAVRRAVNRLYSKKPLPIPTEVHFKVSAQGITLTDNSRKKFFRFDTIHNDSCVLKNKDIYGYVVDGNYVEEIVSTKSLTEQKHYSANIISFCGLDPDLRTWSVKAEGDIPVNNKSIFAFVARRSSSSKDNQCHIFCDLQANQPASAIVSFANKVLPTEKLFNGHI